MFDHCLYFNTTALARRLEREWVGAFDPFGLTPAQAFMLRAILERPGMLQRELAESMSISRPTATRTLDGLQEKGLIERRGLERDGRELEIHPTSAANRMKAALNRTSAGVTARLKDRLGAEAFRVVVSQVKGVRAALE
jgi:MarR family transcriptional regulator, temperature-dependent positive regulator of motility